MKKIYILLIALLTLSVAGCESISVPDLEQENISPADVQKATSVPTEEISRQVQSETQEISLADKMSAIGFEEVSGYYTRRALEDETEYVEMFSFDKDTFVRIATSDVEREVFAYNYVSDDFTYIYYFDGDMAAKTVINIGTGAVLEDEQGYAELLTESADELKLYFNDLMEAAGLVPGELQ